jgi:hypothetical protein
MLNEKKFEAQINRLVRLPFMPKEDEELKALKTEYRRLLRNCRTDAHVDLVVTHLVDHSPRVPSPADLLEAINSINSPETTKSPFGCELCMGTGFVQTQRPAAPPGVLPYTADVAEYCDCPRGRWLADGHKHHFEEERAKRSH